MEYPELKEFDVMALEINEAQRNIVITTECCEGQAHLVEKLKQQAKEKQEIGCYLFNANFKLQFEINQAEQQIISMRTGKETITMANVELKKELLVGQERKEALLERVEQGEKKYEQMWQEAKARYESIPCVRKLFEATAKADDLQVKINGMDHKSSALRKDIQDKKKACQRLVQKRIIQLAEFMVRERPKIIKEINEKSKAVADLKNLSIKKTETKVWEEQKPVEKPAVAPKTIETPDEDGFDQIIPKLRYDSLDLDDLMSVKLDQAEMKRIDNNPAPAKKKPVANYFNISTNSIFNRRFDTDELISSYFPKQISQPKTQNYHKMKLINILEDVAIDARDAMNMVAEINPDKLQPVEVIAGERQSVEELGPSKQDEAPQVEAGIKKVVPTCSKAEDTDSQASKSVSFAPEVGGISQADNNTTADDENNEAMNSQLDVSVVSDDGFTKIREMMLKKHNLDSSPTFVYGKNTMTIQTKTTEKVITSKFFKDNENEGGKDKPDEKQKLKEVEESLVEETGKTVVSKNDPRKVINVEDLESSPKKQKIEELNPEQMFSGFAFKNTAQGVPASLDISLGTGFDLGEFPHCIDSSLLLSPKADMPMNTGKDDVQSEEAPNFLSGLRKTGMSFFGTAAKESQPNLGTPYQESSGFNFNFGGDEKKKRGGLFSMFQ